MASEIAEGSTISQVFPVRNKRGDQRNLTQAQSKQTPEEEFKTAFFTPLLDIAMSSVRERFQQINEVREIFGFLYSTESLMTACASKELASRCACLYQRFGDFDPQELEFEICRFLVILNSDMTQSQLNFLYKEQRHEIYPNLCIALRILVTVPVSVASAEKSFSKLKLIKTFHR